MIRLFLQSFIPFVLVIFATLVGAIDFDYDSPVNPKNLEEWSVVKAEINADNGLMRLLIINTTEEDKNFDAGMLYCAEMIPEDKNSKRFMLMVGFILHKVDTNEFLSYELHPSLMKYESVKEFDEDGFFDRWEKRVYGSPKVRV
jgi:hypothetical protein